MREANYKIPGGKLVKVKLNTTSGKITQVRILGDFFLHPEETIQTIEDSLIGCQEDENSIKKIIAHVLKDSDVIEIFNLFRPTSITFSILMQHFSKVISNLSAIPR